MKPKPEITHYKRFIVACKMFYLTLRYKSFLVIFSKECLYANVNYDTRKVRTKVPKGGFLYTQNSKVDIVYTE